MLLLHCFIAECKWQAAGEQSVALWGCYCPTRHTHTQSCTFQHTFRQHRKPTQAQCKTIPVHADANEAHRLDTPQGMQCSGTQAPHWYMTMTESRLTRTRGEKELLGGVRRIYLVSETWYEVTSELRRYCMLLYCMDNKRPKQYPDVWCQTFLLQPPFSL